MYQQCSINPVPFYLALGHLLLCGRLAADYLMLLARLLEFQKNRSRGLDLEHSILHLFEDYVPFGQP